MHSRSFSGSYQDRDFITTSGISGATSGDVGSSTELGRTTGEESGEEQRTGETVLGFQLS